MENTLYFGENLDVLRQQIDTESVDLIYLDPPFNSKVSYNILYKEPTGRASAAQVNAFEDTWHWGADAAAAFDEIMSSGSRAAGIVSAMRSFLGENDMMAYLVMMAVRLIELHRVLKPTGSLYLHCDPTASHYLKIVLDSIFGPTGFANELVWQRTTPKGLAFTKFAANHDIILAYRKSGAFVWNAQYLPYSEEYLARYNLVDDKTKKRFQATSLLNPNQNRPNLTYEFHGHLRVWRWTKERMLQAERNGKIYFPPRGGVPREKRFLEDQEGVPVSSVWTDIPPVNAMAEERIGYPTQKPRALLERIIEASSNVGDVVLDPFCGCGTAVHAAQQLGRRWIGIDITHIAIQIILDRLKKYFPAESPLVVGRPEDLSGARELARRDKYQFQWWASSLLGGQARGGNRKGPDRGVDGEVFFKRGKSSYGRAIISVKGGEHVSPAMIRDLAGTCSRENADMGIFISLVTPTKEMHSTAAAYGRFDSSYQRIVLLTIEELLQRQAKQSLPPVFDTITVRDEARKRGPMPKYVEPADLRRSPEFMLPISNVRGAGATHMLFEERATWGEEPRPKPIGSTGGSTATKKRHGKKQFQKLRAEPQMLLPIASTLNQRTKELPLDDPLLVPQQRRRQRK